MQVLPHYLVSGWLQVLNKDKSPDLVSHTSATHGEEVKMDICGNDLSVCIYLCCICFLLIYICLKILSQFRER